MLPDIESLRCFVAAARTLNFRAASRTVGLTPAALGQRIKALESQVGVRLFDRTTRRVMLTEAGLAMLPFAQQTLRDAEACVGAARGELGPLPLEITMGTRHELGLSWVEPMLPRLAEDHPHVTFHLYFGSGIDLARRVRSGDVDCGVSSRRIVEPDLDWVRLHREDYAFVGAAALLAQCPLTCADDAKRHTLVDTTEEQSLFNYWRAAPGALDGFSFGAFHKMGTVSAIHSRVRAGKGIAVLPVYLIGSELAEGTLVPILPEITPLHDWFRLFFRADDPRNSLYRAVAATMSTVPLK